MTDTARRYQAGYLDPATGDWVVGIPADDLERVFAPFVTSKAQGLGLGLAVCRTIIQAHRGVLLAATRPGPGGMAGGIRGSSRA